VQGNQQERQNDHPPSPGINNPPDTTNHYTIFPETIPGGPPPGAPFQIPLPPLRREFLKLQALAHPDKFPSEPAKQRVEALSARINEAYGTLADPLRWAQYLLAEWHGIDMTTEDGAAKYEPDPETLMTVMDVQAPGGNGGGRGGRGSRSHGYPTKDGECIVGGVLRESACGGIRPG
jgi:hypothetical protein